MKKLLFSFCLIFGTYIFQSCNNEIPNKDSVDRAKDLNAEKDTAVAINENEEQPNSLPSEILLISISSLGC